MILRPMKRAIIILVLAFVSASDFVHAQKVVAVEWATKFASSPPKLNAEQQKLMPIIQFGVATLPEAKLISMSGAGASFLGIPGNQASWLQEQLISYYKELENDPVFKGSPSSLSYCLSDRKPTRGHATVYLPENFSEESPCILFLHGFGGSFQFYLHFLKTCFPEYLIVCPAYGISMSRISSIYLDESLQAVAEKVGISIDKPTLIGLSAGGVGGFREFANHPQKYRRFVCLAAFPSSKVEGEVAVIAGGEEYFVKDGTLERNSKMFLSDGGINIIPEADHFFLLSHPDQTRKILRRILSN